MLKSFAGFGAAALIAFGLALSSAPANAESVMKQCGDQWQAAKAAGTTNGETWPQFLSQCRAQLKTGAAAPAPAAPAPLMQTVPTPPVTQSPTYGQAPVGGAMMTSSQCDAEYAANKAIKASGQTKRAFVAACRTGNETIPQGAAAAPVPAPAPAPAPAQNRFAGPMAAARRACANANCRSYRCRVVRLRSAGSRPLPLGYGRIGQHEIGRLPFRRWAQLRDHEAWRVHVRG